MTKVNVLTNWDIFSRTYSQTNGTHLLLNLGLGLHLMYIYS
jgi:hypothetical protein